MPARWGRTEVAPPAAGFLLGLDVGSAAITQMVQATRTDPSDALDTIRPRSLLVTEDSLPPMARLAPIVDRMQSLAETELPAPRTCEVTLWDDGTFRIVVWHADEDERQQLRYERTTSEIVWERMRGVGTATETFANGETVFEPTYESFEARVVERVDPPQP